MKLLVLFVLLSVSFWFLEHGFGQGNAGQQDTSQTKIVRDPPEALRVEDMTMEELKKRLAQYEAGKRDDRDGYIIANQLWFNYQGRKETQTIEARHVNELRQNLLRKHLEYQKLQNFSLSDRIQYQQRKEVQKAKALEGAKHWVPPDTIPRKIYGHDKHIVVAYQFKLAFYDLQDDVEARVIKGKRLALFKDGQLIDPNKLKPKKTITFKRSFSLPVERSPVEYRNLLVCTSALASSYSPMSSDEEKNMQALGEAGKVWVNESGTLDHFCGIISLTGNVIYEFAIHENPPTRVVAPVGISADGKRAAVMVGEKVPGQDGVGFYIGRPKEILIWEFPDKLSTKKIPYPATTDEDAKRQFYQGKL